VVDGSTYLSWIKDSAFTSSQIIFLRNATAYTWDWWHHLVGDMVLLSQILQVPDITIDNLTSHESLIKINLL